MAPTAPSRPDEERAARGTSRDDRPPLSTRCEHCGAGMPRSASDAFCCSGCRTVAGLLRASGLERYYDLRGADGTPALEVDPGKRDRKWLEPLLARVDGATGACRIELDVQGVHCAACVWLVQELFERESHGLRAVLNPALGKLELAVERGFDLAGFVSRVERFGYLFGPPVKRDGAAASALVLRIGVAFALALNAMSFSLAIYLGLDSGPFFEVASTLAYVLALASVVVGGSVFVRSAWLALRRGVLHPDTTIALGIVLAFAGSAWSFHFRGGAATYFDTLCVFIALMLVGRWLQQRVVERNRAMLLADEGVDSLLARRVDGASLALVPCKELRAGDRVLVAPGDLVPVEATLEQDQASCSLDWIAGESRPRSFVRGEVVPAGAFNVGTRALVVRATTDFAASALVSLLRTPTPRDADGARATPWWQRYARLYVIAVLATAALATGGWLWATGDVGRAFEVATAVLVVTCPCAFGIATPLAYELVQGGLRRAGLFVRAPGFLDRALHVRRVVFDKTGTLTTGVLGLADEAPLAALDDEDAALAHDLASRSNHPKAVAVRRALERRGASRWSETLAVEEHLGDGLEARHEGRVVRLGRPGWATAQPVPEGTDVVLAVDGVVRAALRTQEALRPDAARELAELAARGYEAWVLSGDVAPEVARTAALVGVPPERAIGALRPEDKAAWLEANDRGDVLFVGDGLNDALVVERAHCAGTPSVDRPFVPSRADFFFTTPGLAPIGLALRASRRLAAVVRRNLVLAIAYNVGAVGLACAGLMTPWLAALLMPASSLAIVATTASALSPRRLYADEGGRRRGARALEGSPPPALALGGAPWRS